MPVRVQVPLRVQKRSESECESIREHCHSFSSRLTLTPERGGCLIIKWGSLFFLTVILITQEAFGQEAITGL
ncbi:MAG: hypothetical protein WBK14_08340, partial [Bacteroidales bacterium]